MSILNIVKNISYSLHDSVTRLISGIARKFRIRTKLIIMISIPVLFLIIQGAISYKNSSNAVDALTTASNMIKIQYAGKYIWTICNGIDNATQQMIQSQDMKNYLNNAQNPSDSMISDQMLYNSNIQTLINASKYTDPNIASIYLLAPGIYSIFPSTINHNKFDFITFQNSDYYKSATAGNGKLVWMINHEDLDARLGIKKESYSITASRIIKNSGKATGMIIADLKYDTIHAILDDLAIKKGEEIHLVSMDGTDISNADAGDGNNIVISSQKFYKEIASGQNENGSFKEQYKGKSCLITYSKDDKSGLVLIDIIPVSIMNSSAATIGNTTILIVILAILAAILIGLFMADSMSRTINRIITAAGRAASGDLTAKPYSSRTDELGDLTKSINSMIASMKILIENAIKTADKVMQSVKAVTITSQHVSFVSGEISNAIQEISKGASSQAFDAEHGVEKINDLSEKINNVTENALSIERLAKETASMTQTGLESIVDLDKKSNETTNITGQIIEDIKELEVRSRSIGKIVKVISNIADQTNLLSLNAAIEAARAGEMGKGFSVVAGEVRKLAEQSLNAAHEISAIIKETQNQMVKTVERAAQAGAILRTQNEAVSGTTQILKDIKASSDELSKQVGHIMHRINEMEDNKSQAISAIQNISAVTQETAASSEEVAASTEEQLSAIEELSGFAEELSIAAGKLEDSISRFKLE